MTPLPSGWARATVGDLAEYINGLAFKPSDWVATGRPIIRIQNLNSADAPFNLTTRPVDERYLVRAGDLLVSWSATLDAFLWNGPEGVLNQHIFKVVPNADIVDGNYLYWAMKSVIREMVLGEHLHGSTMKHINRGPFLAHPVDLPPLQEQRRIAAALRSLHTRRQSAGIALDAVPPLLDKLRQSILAAAFRGDLTADWRATRGVAPSPDVPLGDVCQSSFYGPRFGKDEYVADGVPTIRTTDMTKHGRIVLTSDTPRVRVPADKLEQFRVQRGDLLVTRTGSIGMMAVVDDDQLAVPSAYLIRFRFAPRIDPRFVFIALMSPQGQEQLGLSSTAITQPNVNAEAIKRIVIPLPGIAEQRELVRRVELLWAQLAELTERTEALLRSHDSLDSAILAKAFRGKLVSQNPSDEPAAVLLERLRATPDSAETDGARRRRRKAEVAKDSESSADANGSDVQRPPPPSAPAKHTTMDERDKDAVDASVFAALWSQGPLEKDDAIRRLADHLRDAGVVSFQRLRADGPLYAQLADAIDAAAKAGHLDRPKRGQVRACKPDATAYTADDWRNALLAVLGPSPTDRDDAIRAAAEWARDNCGLEFTRLRADGHIVTGLRSALNSAIRAKLITRIDATRIARAPDSPTDRQLSFLNGDS